MATKDPAPAAPEEREEHEEQQDKKKASSSKKRKTALDEIQVDLSLPEPPSKKARRALKKGKTLPAKPTSDDEGEGGEDSEDGKAKDDKKKKKERSPYGVWIGNLRFTVTKPELRQWLVDNSGGTITDDAITRVHMPTTKPAAGPGPKKAPENRGFAYVDFATFEANVAAIALSETEWYRRKLLIKDNKSFEGRPKKEEPAPVKPDGSSTKAAAADAPAVSGSTKIFVGNLSFNVTEDDLHAHFEKCGKIRWVKVATFEDSGKCKGYGWVNFENAEAAAWAVKGFVKVRETVETLEDFMDVDTEDPKPAAEEADGNASDSSSSGSESDSEDDDEEQDSEKAKKKPSAPQKAATKEPPRIRTRKWWVNQLLGRNLKIELAEDDQSRYNKRFRKGGSAAKRPQQQDSNGGGARQQPQQDGGDKREKKANYQTDISVARLTGAAVAPQGKKVTFD
jgi:RNA recognition motif-containing protein